MRRQAGTGDPPRPGQRRAHARRADRPRLPLGMGPGRRPPARACRGSASSCWSSAALLLIQQLVPQFAALGSSLIVLAIGLAFLDQVGDRPRHGLALRRGDHHRPRGARAAQRGRHRERRPEHVQLRGRVPVHRRWSASSAAAAGAGSCGSAASWRSSARPTSPARRSPGCFCRSSCWRSGRSC